MKSTIVRSSPWIVLLLGVSVVLSACGDRGDAPPPPPKDVATAAGTHALLVGCSEYPTLREKLPKDVYESSFQLLGPVNDVALLQRVLHRYLGVPLENIRALAGEPAEPEDRPTRANILGHLDHLARIVPEGGRVIFLFAGHGSHAADEPGGDETDGRDEIMLPSDTGLWDAATNTYANAIRDDELFAKFTAIREAGATVFAIYDCCHSGGALRAPPPMMDAPGDDLEPEEVRSRGVEPSLWAEYLGAPESTVGDAGTRGVGSSRDEPTDIGASLRGIAAFYAAHSDELAPEMKLPRRRSAPDRASHGLCAYAVATALQHYGASITLAELYQHVRAAYRALPWRDAAPRAQGDLALRVVPGGDDVGKAYPLRQEGGSLVIDAGSLHGLTVGSELEVFHPGGFNDPAKRLGRVRITGVETTRSACGRIEGDVDPAAIPVGAPARVVHLALGGPRLRLALLDPDGREAAPAAVTAFLRSRFPRARDRVAYPLVLPEQAEWHLRPLDVGDAATRYELRPAKPFGRFSPIEVTAEALLEALDRIDRAQSLRKLAHVGPRLPDGLTIEAGVKRLGSERRLPHEPGMAVMPGDTIVLTVTNGSDRDVHVAVKMLDAVQAYIHEWPQGAVSEQLERGDREPAEIEIPIGDAVLGRESLLVIVGERERGAQPLDTERVRVGASADADEDDTKETERAVRAELTEGATRGTSGSSDVSSVTLREVTWITTWGRIVIPPQMLLDHVALEPPIVETLAAGKRSWTHARVLDLGSDAAPAILLRGTEGSGGMVFGLFIDVDGDADLSAADTATQARAAVAGSLPVDLRVVLGADTYSAAYRGARAGSAFVTEFVAKSGEDRARTCRELRDGRWYEREARSSFLSTAHLPEDLDYEGWIRVIRTLRRFSPSPRGR